VNFNRAHALIQKNVQINGVLDICIIGKEKQIQLQINLFLSYERLGCIFILQTH
jgi:hypothetical protein